MHQQRAQTGLCRVRVSGRTCLSFLDASRGPICLFTSVQVNGSLFFSQNAGEAQSTAALLSHPLFKGNRLSLWSMYPLHLAAYPFPNVRHLVCSTTFLVVSAGIPEAEAASKKWTDEYLESKMGSCPRCSVMKSGQKAGALLFAARSSSVATHNSTGHDAFHENFTRRLCLSFPLFLPIFFLTASTVRVEPVYVLAQKASGRMGPRMEASNGTAKEHAVPGVAGVDKRGRRHKNRTHGRPLLPHHRCDVFLVVLFYSVLVVQFVIVSVAVSSGSLFFIVVVAILLLGLLLPLPCFRR